MDPDAALDELRKLAADNIEADRNDEGQEGIVRMSELVQAIDGWMTGGGYLPDRWSSARRRRD